MRSDVCGCQYACSSTLKDDWILPLLKRIKYRPGGRFRGSVVNQPDVSGRLLFCHCRVRKMSDCRQHSHRMVQFFASVPLCGMLILCGRNGVHLRLSDWRWGRGFEFSLCGKWILQLRWFQYILDDIIAEFVSFDQRLHVVRKLAYKFGLRCYQRRSALGPDQIVVGRCEQVAGIFHTDRSAIRMRVVPLHGEWCRYCERYPSVQGIASSFERRYQNENSPRRRTAEMKNAVVRSCCRRP